ncbi:MAG: hypothetical protein AB7R89_13640 [Dehalococcoidia bacterium]
MPPINIYPFQGAETRLVRELVYGVTPNSPEFLRLNGFGVRLKPTVEIDPFAPPGALIPTIPLVNDDFSEGSVEGRVDYNGLAYVLSSLFGPAVITDLGGSPNAYQWVWTWNGRRPLRPVSYTIHQGFADSADVATGFIFNTLEISGGRADGFDVSGDGFAKVLAAGQALGGLVAERQTLSITGGTPTTGTFTLTWPETGETTGNLTFDETAGDVLTALLALDAFDAGDLAVGGGPLPGTPITIDFIGPYLGQDVPLFTTTDSSLDDGAETAIAETTPGSDEVYDVPAIPAGAVQGNVYLNTAWDDLGDDQLLYCYEMGVQIGERMERVRPINKSKSSDGVIDVSDQEHMITLLLGRNAVADAQLAKLRAGDLSFVRAEWEGDAINGSYDYLFQTDACVFYEEAGEPDDNDGVFATEYSGRIAIDPTSGNAIQFTLVNTLEMLDVPA